jgi:hypothetical protein
MRLLAAPCLLLSLPALAGDVVQGANQLAMGGVGAADPGDNAAITMNPGMLGLQERYDLHGHFRLGPTAGMQWAATALDARTSDIVSLGLAYSGDRFEPPLRDSDLPGWSLPGEELGNQKRYHDFTGGLSVALLDRKLSLGFGGNVGLYDHERQGDGWFWDLHAGFGARPVEAVTFGAAVRNFAPGGPEDRPLSVLGGVRGETDRVAVEANVGWLAQVADDRSPLSFGAGVEVPFAEVVRARLGGRWEGPVALPYVTAGIGYEGPDGGLEYGLSVPIGSETTLGSSVHSVSVRFGAPAPITPP